MLIYWIGQETGSFVEFQQQGADESGKAGSYRVGTIHISGAISLPNPLYLWF